VVKVRPDGLVKRVEGTFEGVEFSDVEEPMIVVTSRYPTVRYGSLPKFKLLLPLPGEGTKAIRIEKEWYSDRFPGQPHSHAEFLITRGGQAWRFVLCRGNAGEPDAMWEGEDELAARCAPTISYSRELDP
jgi:hypothetical protein